MASVAGATSSADLSHIHRGSKKTNRQTRGRCSTEGSFQGLFSQDGSSLRCQKGTAVISPLETRRGQKKAAERENRGYLRYLLPGHLGQSTFSSRLTRHRFTSKTKIVLTCSRRGNPELKSTVKAVIKPDLQMLEQRQWRKWPHDGKRRAPVRPEIIFFWGGGMHL